MYKYIGLGLLGLFIIMIYPASSASLPQEGLNLYGAATISLNDEDGNSMFTQTVHNRLFDLGEDFILDQSFTIIGTDVADNVQIGAICLSSEVASTTEGDTASTWNGNNARTGTLAVNCVTAGVGEVTSATQVATVGPLNFDVDADATNVNWVGGDTINSIGVCDAEITDADVRDCTTNLFAVASVSALTPTNGDSVSVTYVFDISSSSD